MTSQHYGHKNPEDTAQLGAFFGIFVPVLLVPGPPLRSRPQSAILALHRRTGGIGCGGPATPAAGRQEQADGIHLIEEVCNTMADDDAQDDVMDDDDALDDDDDALDDDDSG